ncbi:TIGR03960 family B12-binding radical SAM protein [Tissierella sp. MSJ-40]|uniref:TIGR03960 family B12-binding radical SAM protein n=1 Tax=Tissierella simiarum TaxID=2841534 RepID=A0ABS6EC45_9FIRM|nr:TIGR03960 family B12-binding radical SAM protein [Tissierella simiarum]MBU5440020.1 TIGR03960 family B12-binding radical SAM protein [Tissierella simiarum]
MINTKKLDRILKKVEKPARYIGMEQNSIKKDLNNVNVKFAFSFPDVYEVGMSHLGLHILYNLLNSQEDIACERVFAPWIDMEEEMRKEGLPLFTLENKEEVSNFDFLGFTLQYEMSYTNILNMLDLSNIPLLSKNRNDNHPFIIAGGPCAYNPEPLADIIDFFVIGEGEEVTLEILNIYKMHKENNYDKDRFLKEIAQLEGVYVPKFYEVTYKEDGTIQKMEPTEKGVPKIIRKRMIKDLDKMFSPEKMIIPFIETVHDRITLEIFRGCTRGCRFCQAGMIYRPVREKSTERLLELAEKLVESTGYENISLSSLSSCDYSQLELLISQLMDRFEEKKVGVSLPSLRLDSFSIDVIKEIEKVRKTGLTFAPEAGSQRLRDVINKGINEKDLTTAVSYAFKEGWSTIKLYFMIGLPTETDEDVMGIKNLAYKVKDMFFSMPKEERKGNLKVTASASCFVPKPFTPFQWVSQDSIDEFNRKINLLRNSIKDNKVTFNYHDSKLSYLEAIVARGDRRLSKVLVKAWEKGCKFDGWSEHFQYDKWIEALEESRIDGSFYALRQRDIEEILPWDFINPGVSKEYLIKEYKKAVEGELTKDCRLGCTGCGINKCFTGGVCN